MQMGTPRRSRVTGATAPLCGEGARGPLGVRVGAAASHRRREHASRRRCSRRSVIARLPPMLRAGLLRDDS
eukprot:scaffold40918_cov70-Phaeocystis_antarctica.AAC.9